jgi:predicted MPP superfamily phosphohydrolase
MHMAEHLQIPFHEVIVRLANELDGDLVAITGDIVDRRKCIEWIPLALGKLNSRHGVYFVLGNHDQRTGDVQLVRDTLTGCGLIDLGGSCRVIQHNGARILLAGNETPWQKPPLAVSQLPISTAATDVLSVLLSHSPDQLDWARKAGFKLMLAGHTHGGQGRLPWIGPVLSPCLSGVKYSAGIYFEAPTMLHVSRGISGMTQVRINCPPELTKLVLRT